jgi:RHS repeat-associated protein
VGRLTAIVTAAALAPVVVSASASATSPGAFTPHKPQVEQAVAGSPVAVLAPMPDPASAHVGIGPGTNPHAWPTAGAADLTVRTGAASANTSTAMVQAGGLPVSAAAPTHAPGQATTKAAASVPSRVHIDVLDHTTATRAGVNGVVLKVHRSDGGTASAPVTLNLDYSGFRDAYGGGWADRLQLVQLPSCALATPRPTGCARPTAVASTNDTASGHLTAQVQASSADTVFALAASTGGGGAGDFSASTLSTAGSWSAGTQSGDFTYSYPMRVPSVPGGLEPAVTASYASGATDGENYATNNQPSWLGEGWSLGAGAITRAYEPCATAGGGRPNTSDLCFVTDNATLSLGGKTSELIADANGNWHPRSDDGSRVQRLTEPASTNGSSTGEYWVVTTTDGTQYYFGKGQVSGQSTGSAWTVPVFGNGPGQGETCPNGAAWCNQVWQWNLDYVVDRHGDSMTYFYTPETNSYGLNMGAQTVSYVRGGTMTRIEYGTRAGQEYVNGVSQAPATVSFATCDRDTGSGCDQTPLSSANAANFPDMPADQICSASCTTQVAPTFWSSRRLGSVTTTVSGGNVDSWSFDQLYPDPGDGTPKSLWLHGITHTGLVGGSAAVPEVTFIGATFANLVSNPTDGLPFLNKYRITGVDNESGGQTAVTYESSDCNSSALPAPDSNTQRCFPVYWQPPNLPARTSWFAKYVVTQVTNTDLVAGSPMQVDDYDYPDGGAAWAFDDNPMVPAAHRNWDQWRGYAQVTVRHGDPNDTTDTQSKTVYRFFRGLNGDHLSNGGTRSVSFTYPSGFGSTPASVPDNFQDAGFLGEQITYNGVGGAVVTDEARTPVQYGPFATSGTHQSWLIAVGSDVVNTALSSGGFRTTETDTTYTNQGEPVQVNDLGDISTPTDDRCTTTTYATNQPTWVLELPEEVTTVGVACGATPSLPAQAISDVRTSYDGGAPGAAPTAGDATKVEKVTSYTNGAPNYTTEGTTTFDQYGRALSVSDGMQPPRVTKTTYTPPTGIPTSSAVTDPVGFTTTTTFNPALNQPTSIVDANNRETDLAYDPLGRLTGVWKPGQSEAFQDPPTISYAYGVQNNAPNWVSTSTLEPNGNHTTSYTIYDGLLRARQTQSPAKDGSGQRVLSDTFYNSRGLVVKTNGPHVDPAAPGTSLSIVSDVNAENQTRTTYDGAERPTMSAFYSKNVAEWNTTTVYGGDHTDVTPPSGGVPTTTYVDARGNTTEVRRYTGGSIGGAYQDTKDTYTPAGLLATVTDNAENQWAYGYDVSGNRTSVNDPDTGASTATYDTDNEQISSTDAQNNTLSYTYDALGRKTAQYQGSPTTGTKLIGYTYDSLPGGKDLPTSTTRYIGSAAYTSAVTGYDATTGRPTGTSVTIPPPQGALAGAYSRTMTYKLDGSLSSVAEPAIGNLPAETVTYNYDNFGQLSTLGGASTIVSAATYTAFGEPTQYRFGPSGGSNAWQTLYYDEATRRPTGEIVERNVGVAEVDDNNYTYDPAGNVTSATDTIPSTTPGVTTPVTDTQCFTYDGLDELTQAWTDSGGAIATDPSGNPVGAGTPTPSTGRCNNTTPATANISGPAPYWQTYGYDMIGNRTSTTNHGIGGAADTNTVNHYVAPGNAQPHTPQTATITNGSNTETANYVYNAAGDTTTRPAPDGSTQSLTWDSENNLASVTTNGKTSNYIYDTSGNLLISQDSTGATLYLPNGEIHASTTGATGTRYYSAGTAAGAATLAVRTSSGLEYQFADPHGTSTLSIDASTMASTQRRYDPFGNLRQTPTPTAWPDDKGFVNGVVDSADGLERLGARDYDPTTGRFVSADPLLNPSDPAHLNAYTYAENNPTTNSDPTGLYTVGVGCPDRECLPPSQAPSLTVPQPPHMGDGNRFHCPDGSCNPNFNLAPGLYHQNPRMGDGNRFHCPDGSCNPYFTLAPGLRHVAAAPTAPKLPGCYGVRARFDVGCDPYAPPPPDPEGPLPSWVTGAAHFVWNHAGDITFDVAVACVITGGTACLVATAGLAVLSTVKDAVTCGKTGSCGDLGLDIAGDAITVVTGGMGAVAGKALEEGGKGAEYAWEFVNRAGAASTLPAQGMNMHLGRDAVSVPDPGLGDTQVIAPGAPTLPWQTPQNNGPM